MEPNRFSQNNGPDQYQYQYADLNAQQMQQVRDYPNVGPQNMGAPSGLSPRGFASASSPQHSATLQQRTIPRADQRMVNQEDNMYVQGHHAPSVASAAQTPAKALSKNANDSTMKKNKNEKRNPATDEKNSNQAQKSGKQKKAKADNTDDERSTAHAATPKKPEERKKKKQNKKENTRMQEEKPMRVVFNVFNTIYDVIKEVGKKDFNWKLSQRDPWNTQIEWDIQWADVAPMLERWKEMKPFQKINHFPGMYQIARKNYLARNLNKMQKQFPDDYKFFPKTWLLPHQLEDLKSYSQSNPAANFIVKPEAMSQGKGIFITRKFDQIDMTEHLVVQKYIKNPFLIDGFKFDFRIYVLVTNVQPLRIFIFRDGLARFASEKYKLKAFNNPFIHLTNYAINKDNANYKVDQSADAQTGHKRTLDSIFVKIAREGVDIEVLKRKMRDMVVKTLISVQPDLVHHYRTSQPSDIYHSMCFEILGFDILVDKNGNPQLLEVNHAPSFNCDTALDAQVKRNLLHDTFCLINSSVQEKQHIIGVLQQMHEQRVLGINKNNKDFYQQRNEMYQIKLKEKDEYQLLNLGNYERVFPPMKLYHETIVPPEEPTTPLLDPLSQKLRLLDKRMNRHNEEKELDKQANQIIPGNTTDEKLHSYYQNFQNVAKQFVADMRVTKAIKPNQDQRGKPPIPIPKAPPRKKEVKPNQVLTSQPIGQLPQAKQLKQGGVLGGNPDAAEIDGESGGSESLGSDYEESKLNAYHRGGNAGNPQMGEYEEPSVEHQDPYGQYGTYAHYLYTEEENSEAEEQQANLFDGVADAFKMEHAASFSTPGQSARQVAYDHRQQYTVVHQSGANGAASRARGYSTSDQQNLLMGRPPRVGMGVGGNYDFNNNQRFVHQPQPQIGSFNVVSLSKQHKEGAFMIGQAMDPNRKPPAGIVGLSYHNLVAQDLERLDRAAFSTKNGSINANQFRKFDLKIKSQASRSINQQIHKLQPDGQQVTSQRNVLLPDDIRDSIMLGPRLSSHNVDALAQPAKLKKSETMAAQKYLAGNLVQQQRISQSRASQQNDYRDRTSASEQVRQSRLGQSPQKGYPASVAVGASGARTDQDVELRQSNQASTLLPDFRQTLARSPDIRSVVPSNSYQHGLSPLKHRGNQKLLQGIPSNPRPRQYPAGKFLTVQNSVQVADQAEITSHPALGYELPQITQKQNSASTVQSTLNPGTQKALIDDALRQKNSRLSQSVTDKEDSGFNIQQKAMINKTIMFPSMFTKAIGSTPPAYRQSVPEQAPMNTIYKLSGNANATIDSSSRKQQQIPTKKTANLSYAHLIAPSKQQASISIVENNASLQISPKPHLHQAFAEAAPSMDAQNQVYQLASQFGPDLRLRGGDLGPGAHSSQTVMQQQQFDYKSLQEAGQLGSQQTGDRAGMAIAPSVVVGGLHIPTAGIVAPYNMNKKSILYNNSNNARKLAQVVQLRDQSNTLIVTGSSRLQPSSSNSPIKRESDYLEMIDEEQIGLRKHQTPARRKQHSNIDKSVLQVIPRDIIRFNNYK